MNSSPPDPPAIDNRTSLDGKRATSPISGKMWALLALLLVVAFAIWRYPYWKATAEVGSAYGARVGCSCRYIQGRDIKSCESDFEPGMEMISLDDDPATKTVTASAPLIASRSAHYAGDSGCLLDGEN